MSTKIPIATVGLGLMGSSIATCILAAGHTVTSLVKTMDQAEEARQRILGFLQELEAEGMLVGNPLEVLGRLTITDDVALLKAHEVVIESIVESVEEKKLVYRRLETVLSPTDRKSVV